MGEASTVTREAHAKVNLRLRVLGPETSGYHSLETIFLRLHLHDILELTTGGDGIELSVDGQAARGVPTGPDNLAWQAAAAYYRAAGEEPGVSIRLRKRLPVAAGLGGGSSDAAAVLTGLHQLHRGAVPEDELFAIAGELGSDVAFALSDRPAALAWGRGQRLLPLRSPSSRPMLVVCPDFGVESARAYGWLDEDRAGDGASAKGAALPGAGRLSTWEGLLSVAGNDLEAPVFRRHAELETWKARLEGAGADLALLSGSGSSLFAVFGEKRARDAAARDLRDEAGEHAWVLATRGPV